MTEALTTITSPTDPRLTVFQLRHEGRYNQASAMIVDSERVIRRFLRRAFSLDKLLATPDCLAQLLLEFPDLPLSRCFQAERPVLEAIVGFRFHQGAIALFRERADAALAELGSRIVAFDGVADAENVGAVVRSAHAMGFSGILIGETSCSPWLRRAIRVSMGSIAKLAVRHSENLAHDLTALNAGGFHIVGLAASTQAVPLAALSSALSPLTLVVGSENDGLRPTVETACTTLAHIPMAPGCDSLNAAIATSIACYHFRNVTPPTL